MVGDGRQFSGSGSKAQPAAKRPAHRPRRASPKRRRSRPPRDQPAQLSALPRQPSRPVRLSARATHPAPSEAPRFRLAERLFEAAWQHAMTGSA
jgi:hypothetical protein